MKILRDLLSEMVTAGAVGAGAIAGFRGSLFAPLKRRKQEKYPKIQVIRFSQKPGYNFVKEDTGEKFDQADVISKLKASEKRNELGRDAVAFGMENEDGEIVKVYVRAEQAEDFEKALARALGKEGEDNEDETTEAVEIAEILFKLRDKFDIIDVQWPEIQGDEEEEGEGALGAEGGVPPEGEEPVESEPPAEGGEPIEPEENKEDIKSTLDKVISMLSANAEAQKAEAEAKKAEADSKTAEANAKAAEAKVKQEEEVLDMEDYYSQKTEKDKEAKQLAKLAKWKHDLAKDAGEELNAEESEPEEVPAPPAEEELPSEEEEEMTKVGSTPKTLPRAKFVDFLRAQLKAQR